MLVVFVVPGEEHLGSGRRGVVEHPIGTESHHRHSGDDSEQELTFNASTTPALTPGTWSALDIPLSDFTNLAGRAHLAQLLLAGTSTVFVDNVYLHR